MHSLAFFRVEIWQHGEVLQFSSADKQQGAPISKHLIQGQLRVGSYALVRKHELIALHCLAFGFSHAGSRILPLTVLYRRSLGSLFIRLTGLFGVFRYRTPTLKLFNVSPTLTTKAGKMGAQHLVSPWLVYTHAACLRRTVKALRH